MVSEEFEVRAFDRIVFERRHGQTIREMIREGKEVPESLMNEEDLDVHHEKVMHRK